MERDARKKRKKAMGDEPSTEAIRGAEAPQGANQKGRARAAPKPSTTRRTRGGKRRPRAADAARIPQLPGANSLVSARFSR